MDTLITWFVIALFYIPVHYLLPVLIVVMRSSEQRRRAALIRTLIDCSLSMAASFVLVIWLVSQDRISVAMAILLLSMTFPYVRILASRPEPRT
jgi:hypothetical protein